MLYSLSELKCGELINEQIKEFPFNSYSNRYSFYIEYLHNEIGMIQTARGKLEEAIAAFGSAIEYNDKSKVQRSMSNIHYNIGVALQRAGRNEHASMYLQKAIQGYRDDLARMPGSAKVAGRLGNVLAEVGNFTEATEFFRRAVQLDPYDIDNHSMLAKALVVQKRYDEAIEELKKAKQFVSQIGNEAAELKFQRDIEQIELEKAH